LITSLKKTKKKRENVLATKVEIAMSLRVFPWEGGGGSKGKVTVNGKKEKKERNVQQDGGQLHLDNRHALSSQLLLSLLLVKEYGKANSEQCSPTQLRTQYFSPWLIS
jgi:hypothetical protein